MKKIILSTIAVLALFVGYGQAGALDPSFATNGWTTVDFIKGNFYPESGKQILLQSSTTYIVVLEINAYTVLARYTTKNNTIDKTYGSEGFSVPVNLQNGKAALQSDGKIVVTGLYNVNNQLDFGVARFNTDGSLDNSFGTNGMQTTDFFGDWDWPFDIAIQTDGKIVVAGQISSNTYDFGLARYNTNGTLDGDFGTNGIVTTDFFGDSDFAVAIAIQTDGKVVVAGQVFNTGGTNFDFGIARYTANGTLDQMFGVNGLQTTDFQGHDYAYAVSLQGDGKIVVAGQSYTSITSSDDFAVARYNVDGTPDNTFDTDGQQTTDLFGWYDKAYTLAIQSDGKIVLGGTGNSDNQNFDFCLVRYNTNGSLDTGFDGDGKVTTDFFGYEDVVYNIVIQSDGKILAVGDALNLTSNFDFAVARYNTNGSLDQRFDRDGKLTGYYPSGIGNFTAVAVQSDGKIVAAGYAYNTSYNSDFVLARFNPNGTLDKTFSRTGIQITDFWGQDDYVYAIAIQNDGKIVVAGATKVPDPQDPESYLSDFAIARYNTNGVLDNKFDKDGRQTTDFFGKIDEAYAIALQADGKIVVTGGVGSTETGSDFGLARYNTNGSLDGTFGSGGKQTADFSSGYDIAYGVGIQNDGKLVAAGFTYISYYTDFALARFTSNGTLDISFDGDGKQTTDFGGYYDDGRALAIQDNKIVVAGSVDKGYLTSTDFGIARYNISDGSLDETFGDNGKQTTDFFGDRDYGFAMALQADGKIIVVGGVYNGATGGDDFGLARYTSDGVLDETFDVDGKQAIPFSFGYDDAFAAAIRGTTLYVAGLTRRPTDKCVIAAYSLGTIMTPLFTGKRAELPDQTWKLTAKVVPNPSATSFDLRLQSGSDSPATIRITNAAGQLVETLSNIAPGSKLAFGANYRPGIYYVEVIQGAQKVTLKLIKQ